MTPFQEAREVYRKESCVRSFEEDLGLHLSQGFVLSTDKIFIMARPVIREAEPELIINPIFTFPKERWNCWHVYLMAGDISKCWLHYPYDLPWVSFERKNDLRFYPMSYLKERCQDV